MPADNLTFQPTAGQNAQAQLIYDRLHCMAEGGSRSSKTFGWIYAMIARGLQEPSTHLVMRRYYKDARQSLLIGDRATIPEVFRLVYPAFWWEINRTDWYVTFGGHRSTLWVGGMDTAERMDKVLGRQFSTIFFNETSEMDYGAVLTVRSRLAEKTTLLYPRFLYDQNPPAKSHWTYREFHQGVDPTTRDRRIAHWERDYGVVKINPECNRQNIAEGYIETILEGLPERQRRRFLLGEYADETESGIWKQPTIDLYRITDDQAPAMGRVVVAIDPNVGGPHEAGIMVGGKGQDGHYYVLEDGSGKLHPLEWGRRAIELYDRHGADRIVGEVNNGGDLVELNVRNCPGGQRVAYRAVRASRGKHRRAEPVASLYERGMVHHVGRFQYLEDEMTSYDPGRAEDDDNPANRMDALVWLLTELAGLSDDAADPFSVLGRCARKGE